MAGNHAKLSPSSAERWMECPASVRMSEQVPPEPESSYAAEGTLAHTLGEMKAALAFGQIDEATYAERRSDFIGDLAVFLGKQWDDMEVVEALAEMDRHTDAYVELIRERAALHPHTQILLEQRMSTGLPDDGKGTSDTVLVSPEHVEIIDLKYGAGVAVEAEGNPQLRLYAMGALETYGDVLGDTEVVRMTVFQPRMEHTLTAEMTPESLREWHSTAVEVAKVALGPDAPFGPSETACRWCPVSGRCPAQVEAAFPDDLLDDEPETLSPERIAHYLGKLPELREWLKAFESAALTQAYSEGIEIPGYKVIRSGGQRRISDDAGAIRYLTTKKGFHKAEVTVTKIRGIGELEKLMGKEEFAIELAEFITRSEGRESLVPESDKRPAITPHTEASSAFDDIEE